MGTSSKETQNNTFNGYVDGTSGSIKKLEEYNEQAEIEFQEMQRKSAELIKSLVGQNKKE